MKTEALGSCE